MEKEIMSLFDFLEDGDDFKSSEEVKTETNKKEKSAKESKDTKKKGGESKKTTPKVKTREEKLEDQLKTLDSVKISLWGNVIKTLVKEELQSLKVSSLNSLMVDNGYEEFSIVKYTWDLGLSEDKKTGFLTPRYADFHHKG